MVDVATIFAWFVIAVLFAVAVASIVALGSLPGHIARKRNHPHIEAINAASWVGLALGGIGWPIAFVWAWIPFAHATKNTSNLIPVDEKGTAEPHAADLEVLRRQIADLQAEIRLLKKNTHQTS